LKDKKPYKGWKCASTKVAGGRPKGHGKRRTLRYRTTTPKRGWSGSPRRFPPSEIRGRIADETPERAEEVGVKVEGKKSTWRNCIKKKRGLLL